MVAATGGHLAELVRLSPRLADLPDPRLWVTFDTIQSRDLLQEEDVIFVPFTAPRDAVTVLRNMNHAHRIFANYRISAVVSTGSAIANSFMPLATARGIPCFYIECSARTHGPSVTGRFLRVIPRVRRFTQFQSWASERWMYAGSVFDTFAPLDSEAQTPPRLKIVVTVGTLDYSFRRLFERLIEIVPTSASVIWQHGATTVGDLGLPESPFMAPQLLDQAMREADVVVAHAGIGSALAALDAGRSPVLVPRRRAYGEHVDDHQLEIAETLVRRGLALSADASHLDLAMLEAASRRRIRMARGQPMRLKA